MNELLEAVIVGVVILLGYPAGMGIGLLEAIVQNEIKEGSLE